MGRQRQFDPNAAYDGERYLIVTTVICVPGNGMDLVLMVSDKAGTKWKLPGGACNWNETIEEAAIRELYEESGVNGRIDRFVGMFQNREKRRRMYVFVMTYSTHDDRWREGDIYSRQRNWFAVSSARQWLMQDYLEQMIYLDRFWMKRVKCRIVENSLTNGEDEFAEQAHGEWTNGG